VNTCSRTNASKALRKRLTTSEEARYVHPAALDIRFLWNQTDYEEVNGARQRVLFCNEVTRTFDRQGYLANHWERIASRYVGSMFCMALTLEVYWTRSNFNEISLSYVWCLKESFDRGAQDTVLSWLAADVQEKSILPTTWLRNFPQVSLPFHRLWLYRLCRLVIFP